jgi:hypothetical protein
MINEVNERIMMSLWCLHISKIVWKCRWVVHQPIKIEYLFPVLICYRNFWKLSGFLIFQNTWEVPKHVWQSFKHIWKVLNDLLDDLVKSSDNLEIIKKPRYDFFHIISSKQAGWTCHYGNAAIAERLCLRMQSFFSRMRVISKKLERNGGILNNFQATKRHF